MYNTELKEKYLLEEQNNTRRQFIETLFKRSEKYEVQYGKDLHEFTLDNIIYMYKSSNYKSLDSIRVVNSTYSQYTTWCNDENHFTEMTTSMFCNMLNKDVITNHCVTREKILEWCRELPNPCDKFILLGLFEGLSGKDYCEFVNLERNDIDFEFNTITVSGIKKPFSRNLCLFAEESADENNYYPMTVEGNSRFEYVSFKPSSKVIKDYPNTDDNPTDFRKGRRIYHKIMRIFRYLGVESYMSPKAVRDSGIIETLRNIKKENNLENGVVFTDKYRIPVEEKYNRSIRKRTLLLQYDAKDL